MTSDQIERGLADILVASIVGPPRLMKVDEPGAIERRHNSQTPV